MPPPLNFSTYNLPKKRLRISIEGFLKEKENNSAKRKLRR